MKNKALCRAQHISIVVCILLFAIKSQAQHEKQKEVKLGIGLGIDEGKREIGVGGVFVLGFQQSFFNNRMRMGPTLTSGNFLPFGVTDTRDQYFRSSTLDFTVNYDLIKIKAFSVFAGAGALANYSRGLLGTGGWPSEGNKGSDYFFSLYAGGKLNAGFRVNPENKNYTVELIPFNINFGTNYFLFASWNLVVGIKLNSN